MNARIDADLFGDPGVAPAPVKPAQSLVSGTPVVANASSETKVTKAPPGSLARKTPDLWLRPLSSIPERFRQAMLDLCWAEHDRLLAQEMAKPRIDRVRNNMVEKNLALTTPISEMSYAAFLPLHLVTSAQEEQACKALRSGVWPLAQWLKEQYPSAAPVMVVSDDADPQRLREALQEHEKSHPIKTLIAGPSRSLLPILRSYADEAGLNTACFCSLDGANATSVWDQVPGTKLDKTVQQLFAQFSPQSILALDPVRSPASLQVLEEARKRGLKLTFIESTAATPKARSGPRP